MWQRISAQDTRKRGAFLETNKKNTKIHIKTHTMEIDKTFHYSDPETIVCYTCKFCVYDMERGEFCKLHEEPIKDFWRCDNAKSVRG